MTRRIRRVAQVTRRQVEFNRGRQLDGLDRPADPESVLLDHHRLHLRHLTHGVITLWVMFLPSFLPLRIRNPVLVKEDYRTCGVARWDREIAGLSLSTISLVAESIIAMLAFHAQIISVSFLPAAPHPHPLLEVSQIRYTQFR